MKKNAHFSTIIRNVLTVFLILYTIPYAAADGVTIMTHGWNVGDAPAWLDSMRDAMSENHLNNERNYGKITVTNPGTGLVAACDPWNFDMTSGTTGEILIVLDWSAVANHLVGGPPAQDVAAVIIDTIVSGRNGKAPLAELPIHLIGHSRGGGMVCEIARRLGEKGIIVDHLTPLDPHPLTTDDSQPLFNPVIDTPTAVYENIIFADCYLQNTEYPQGETISGAWNRIWGAMAGGYYDDNLTFSNHRNIYLMYQGTVDLNNPVNNGEAEMDAAERAAWFTAEESGGDRTGFCFSRIKGAVGRKTDGIHSDTLFGGSGIRQNLTWSEAVWPNIADLQVSRSGTELGHGSHSVSIGTNLDLRYLLLDFDSGSTVTLHADTDRNPYNDNDQAMIGDPVQYGATGKTFEVKNMSWDTSAMADGTRVYVYAEITDGSRTRYFYAPPQLVFSDDSLSLGYAVSILRLLAELPPGEDISRISDVSGDQALGIEEAVYYLQKTAGMRN